MSILSKHSDMWKDSELFVKNGGLWKKPQSTLIKHSGLWKGVERNPITPPLNQLPANAASNYRPYSFRGSPYSHSGGLPIRAAQVQVSLYDTLMEPLWDSGAVLGDGTEVFLDDPGGIIPTASTVYWAIRYQASDGRWSDWSAPTFFGTASSYHSMSPGQSYGGGYFIGIQRGYIHILATKSAEALQYWGGSGGWDGTESTWDSKGNTTLLVNKGSKYYAANFCRAYKGGGYSDWDLPALDVLLLIKENLSPTNPITPSAFRSGGSQAMNPSGATRDRYWASTEADESRAYAVRYSDGFVGRIDKSYDRLARPTRSIRA